MSGLAFLMVTLEIFSRCCCSSLSAAAESTMRVRRWLQTSNEDPQIPLDESWVLIIVLLDMESFSFTFEHKQPRKKRHFVLTHRLFAFFSCTQPPCSAGDHCAYQMPQFQTQWAIEKRKRNRVLISPRFKRKYLWHSFYFLFFLQGQLFGGFFVSSGEGENNTLGEISHAKDISGTISLHHSIIWDCIYTGICKLIIVRVRWIQLACKLFQ